MRTRFVSEYNWGVYLAKSNDNYIMDEDQNFLCIEAVRNDASRIKHLIKVAKSYGLENISVEFQEGIEKVTDEEYERQKSELNSGLMTPSNSPEAFQ